MKPHFEANTKWLWKLFQVNTTPGRTEANCNTNEMLTLWVYIIIHCDLFFPLQSKTNDSQVKAPIFSLKPLTEVGPSNKTVELPSMRSSSEINTMLKWMFSDANCLRLGPLCHLHTPAPHELTLRTRLPWLPATQSRPWSLDTDGDIPLKCGCLSWGPWSQNHSFPYFYINFGFITTLL